MKHTTHFLTAFGNIKGDFYTVLIIQDLGMF